MTRGRVQLAQKNCDRFQIKSNESRLELEMYLITVAIIGLGPRTNWTYTSEIHFCPNWSQMHLLVKKHNTMRIA
jgi:hypothetical protein